jgi:hypothetical protein
MSKNVIKLTESELEGLVKKIISEEKKVNGNEKQKLSSKRMSEGKEFIRKFHKRKNMLIKEGYSKSEINEQLEDFLGFGSNSLSSGQEKDSSFLGDIGMSSAKQWITGWILSQLGVTGELNQILSIALSNADPKDYKKLFDPVDNCDFLADLLFETFLNYLLRKVSVSFGSNISKGSSGAVSGVLSSDLLSIVTAKSMMSLFDNFQFKKDLKKIFAKSVCEALGGRTGEMELSSDLDRSEFPDQFVRKVKKDL